MVEALRHFADQAALALQIGLPIALGAGVLAFAYLLTPGRR